MSSERCGNTPHPESAALPTVDVESSSVGLTSTSNACDEGYMPAKSKTTGSLLDQRGNEVESHDFKVKVTDDSLEEELRETGKANKVFIFCLVGFFAVGIVALIVGLVYGLVSAFFL